MRPTPDKISAFMAQLKKMMNFKSLVITLAAIVVFTTTYLLVLPAFTLDKEEAAEQGGIDVAVEQTVDEEAPAEQAEEPAADQKESADSVTEAEEPAAKEEVKEETASPKQKDNDAKEEKKDSNVKEEKEEVKLLSKKKELTAEKEKTDDFTVSAVVDKAAKVPEDVFLQAAELTKDTKDFDYDKYYKDALKALKKDSDNVEGIKTIKFYDISLEAESQDESVEPKATVNVKIAYEDGLKVNDASNIRIVHFAEQKDGEVKAEVLDSKENKVETTVNKKSEMTEASFDTEGFSVFAVAETTLATQVITAEGKSYTIEVTYDSEAKIPEGSTLQAREILEGTKEYETYYEKTLKTLQEQATEEEYLAGLDFARFFDVSIYDSEGSKIEPKAPVEVKITYTDPLKVTDAADLKVVHFADQGTEVIDIDNEGQSVSEIVYEQNGFSVIGTIGATDDYGWPQGAVNPYVMILQSGDKYYAVAHDGSLKEVHYLNGTVSFMGQGTTTLDYLDDYLWNYTAENTTRHTASLSFTNSDDVVEYVYPYYGLIHPEEPDRVIGPGRRPLSINQQKVYARYYNVDYYISADGGILHRTDNPDDASTIFFAPRSNFMANSSEAEDYDFIDIETLIEEWQKQMTQDMVVDKTAEVYDYENRIYQVDLAASSGYHRVTPALALEFVVDASRSMYFPENLYERATYRNLQGFKDWITNNGDHSQVYYVITEPNGQATNWAVYYDSGWHVVDASNYDPPDGVGGRVYTLNGWNYDSGDGKIYIADEKIEGQPWCRLDYMKLAVTAAAKVLFAVDPSAQIGLVQFNSGVDSKGPFTLTGTEQYSAGNEQALINALNDISLSGGTNHTIGLERARNDFTDKFNQIRNCQSAVVLITDGAPNQTTWEEITSEANRVKNMTNAHGQHTRLFTLGLSLQNVGDNKDKLAAIATDASHSFNAEKSSEVVSFLTKIIEGLVVDANLKGNVTDVIDEAFYPIDSSTGKPVESGTWITLDGEVTSQGAADAAGQIINDNGTWKVEWKNQLIKWPDKQTGKHGWSGRIYLKAKEDFLGGNDIKTNAPGSQAEALKYIHPTTGVEYDISEDDTERIEAFSTPYVNVDELLLDENSTEWTVYLGESVDPKKEVQNLIDKINVYEVVKEDGNLVYTLTEGSTTNPTSKADTGKTFPLSDIIGTLTNADWNSLIEGDTKEFEYTKYGHTPGYITISLAQDVESGEKNLTESPHNTAVVGEKVEKYTLTVTYEPIEPSIADYHTGMNLTSSHGANTDNSVSENVHVINVFAKGMQITKTDTSFKKELIGSKFVLYRTARSTDDSSKVTKIEGAEGNYYPVAELDLSTTAVGTINPVEKLEANEKYYLVETVAPAGHILLDHPLPVTLTITDSFIPKPGTTSQETRPADGIYDWTQTAVLNITNSAVQRTDANNTQDLTHAALVADSENAILYFRIANPTGVELPMTGGIGTTIFYILGSILAVGCGIVLIARRRAGISR